MGADTGKVPIREEPRRLDSMRGQFTHRRVSMIYGCILLKERNSPSLNVFYLCNCLSGRMDPLLDGAAQRARLSRTINPG